MDLYNHQQDFLNKNPDRCLLAHGTGTGKTRTSIEWSKLHEGLTLIICPKSIVYKWVEDIQQWDSEIKEITEHNDKQYALSSSTRDYIVVSKERFKAEYKNLSRPDNIIVDEAHFFAGTKSQLSKSLITFIKVHDIQRIILATATPYLSSPDNIYRLAQILRHKWDYWEFKKQYFKEQYFGHRRVMVPRDNIEGEIAELVASIGNVVAMEDCTDVPEQTFEVEYFSLNKKQEKLIKDSYDPNPIVRFTKKHQIENGTLKGDEFTEDKLIPCDKIDRIKDLAESNDKIIFVARYNLQVEMIEKALEKIDKPVLKITGATKDRHEVVKKAEGLSKCVMIINAACSCGYELPSFPTMVFASNSFSFVDFQQIIGRILRMNKLKKNTYIHLLTKDGVDEAVYDAINRKKDFDIAIYAQNKSSD